MIQFCYLGMKWLGCVLPAHVVDEEKDDIGLLLLWRDECVSSLTKVTKRNTQLYKMNIGNVITLMGRCDGVQEVDDENVIIEVKNRQKWFFYPIYEKVQIHAYMAMTKINKCILIQRLHGVDKKDFHGFEMEFWEEIETRLIDLYEKFNIICTDSNEQDKLFE